MLLISLAGWWYGKGFLIRLRGLGESLGRTADRFSIGLLLKTLFNPFRQIDAGVKGKGLEGMVQAFLSRLISRIVGFMMRVGLIIVGTVMLVGQLVGSGVIAIAHLAIPVLPIVGVVMMLIGWVPEVGGLW